MGKYPQLWWILGLKQMSLFRKELLEEHNLTNGVKNIAVLFPSIHNGVSIAKLAQSRIPIPEPVYIKLSFKCLMPQMMALTPSSTIANYKGQQELHFVVDTSFLHCKDNKTMLVSVAGKFELRRAHDVTRKDVLIGKVIGQFNNQVLGIFKHANVA
ncbi:hypothetical protein [Alteromonas gilva]|uniref:Uncharacterized protein n=1 Tax=Alteromonas gilva TaxID=2987522 RepID=A0ABT5L6W0_9ALTE|nr:hypothetical protein [Alteromonas gilva]MDC8832805.1 hypothetical protein [Alteromonas gilva]